VVLTNIPAKTINTIAVILITLILTFFTLVFGELVPKRVAMKNAKKLALGMAGLISGVAKIFAPLVWLLTASTNGILRLLGVDPNAEDDEVTEEEIRMMVDVGTEKGTIEASEKEMIHNIFEFDDVSAEDILTHRTQVDISGWTRATATGRRPSTARVTRFILFAGILRTTWSAFSTRRPISASATVRAKT
jgi:putative hemolysin